MEGLTFGEYIKSKRKEQRIKLKDMAERFGISPNYMCSIEKNNPFIIPNMVS